MAKQTLREFSFYYFLSWVSKKRFRKRTLKTQFRVPSKRFNRDHQLKQIGNDKIVWTFHSFGLTAFFWAKSCETGCT